MTVWAVLDKDERVIVLTATPEHARKLASLMTDPGIKIEEMAVLS